VVPAVGADENASALGEAGDPEGTEEGVEETRVISVLHVLDIELPVVRQHLDEAAQYPDGSAQHAGYATENLLAQVGLDARRLRAQAREDQPVHHGRPELARAVGRLGEFGRHAAPAIRTLLEGDTGEIALEVVSPRVVDALEMPRGAVIVERDQSTPVCAAILEGTDAPVVRAHDNHRHLPHEGRAEVTGVREIHLEADEAPGGALEDAPELRAVVGLVLVEPVGDAGEGRVRPRARRIGRAHARCGETTT
jgi:hypothetical protein